LQLARQEQERARTHVRKRVLLVVNRVFLFPEHVAKVPIGIQQRWRRAAERAVRLQGPYVQEKANVDFW
jgi:hypothetical protein